MTYQPREGMMHQTNADYAATIGIELANMREDAAKLRAIAEQRALLAGPGAVRDELRAYATVLRQVQTIFNS